MEYDLKLFHDFEKELIPSTLRIYSWRPKCISLGYSQKVEEEVYLEKVRSLGWEVIGRPTGGGIVFHNEAEVSYSLITAMDDPLLPKGLIPSYKRISEAVVFGLKRLGLDAQIKGPHSPRPETCDCLCFSYPVEYEVVFDGKKIVGSAQKRGRKTLLQQGSIFVRCGNEEVLSVLKRPCEKINAISVEEILEREVGFEELCEALVKGFEECLGIKLKT